MPSKRTLQRKAKAARIEELEATGAVRLWQVPITMANIFTISANTGRSVEELLDLDDHAGGRLASDFLPDDVEAVDILSRATGSEKAVG